MRIPVAPPSASTLSGAVDAITLCLLILSGMIAGMVFLLILWFSLRYRKGSGHSRIISKRRSFVIEWSWTIATFFIFIGLFCWAATVYFQMHAPPADSAEIQVVGKQWMWKFQHADGRQELNELHVPTGQPILMTMTSQDVIHSLFIPAFRIKQDVLPGRYERTWFQATIPGEYEIYCTQYCGTAHADMRARVIVLTPENYQRWLQSGITRSSIQGEGVRITHGRALFTKFGCIQCHAPGAAVKCPELSWLFGKQVVLTDGTSVTADENYLRESIVNPSVKIVAGFSNIMPSFSKQASEEDLLDLIAYIKSLSSQPPGAHPQ